MSEERRSTVLDTIRALHGDEPYASQAAGQAATRVRSALGGETANPAQAGLGLGGAIGGALEGLGRFISPEARALRAENARRKNAGLAPWQAPAEPPFIGRSNDPLDLTPAAFAGEGPPTWTSWLQTLARDALSTPDEEDDLLLSSMFEGIPLGTGFWTRLAGGEITDEDRELMLPLAGSAMDDDLRDKVLKKLIRGYGDVALKATDMQTGGYSSSGLYDPSMEGVPPGTSWSTPAARQSMTERLKADTKGGLIPGTDTPDLWRERNGKIYARLDPKTGQWKPSGDLGDPDVVAAIKETAGTYSFEDVEPILRDENPAATAAKKLARAQIEEEWEHEYADIRLKTARMTLDAAGAKARVDKALEKVTIRKAQVDLEAAELDLLLRPLAHRTAQATLDKMKLDYDQAQARYPQELELLKEQVSDAREKRLDRERTRRREQANDRFSREVYPSLISAIAPVGEQPAPPPVYNQLTQRAGVGADDPNAQLAFTALQQTMGGSAP